METREVRVRFAPSPSGYLHVGGARTALYNWLYARANNGKFILRIEDTDQSRSTQESIDTIIDSIKWMGLDWDEGPIHQAERLDIYKEYAQKLVDAGKAEKTDDGTEAVIFKFPKDGVTIINDLVHGKIEFQNADIKDQVLIKSDGFPAYNFACVVDDALMNISHVIRGDDHISNTPKQIPIYLALGFKPPKYAHIPLIMGKDNTRLSKRHGATSVGQYKEKGYLPEAFNNYLALLGWSAGDNKEIFSTQELVKKFSIKRVTGKAAIFDIDKFDWLNGKYLKSSKIEDIYDLSLNILKDKELIDDNFDKKWISSIIELYKSRVRNLALLPEEADYFFKHEIKYDKELLDKFYSDNKTSEMIKRYGSMLKECDDFNVKCLEDCSKKFVEDEGIKGGDLIHPLRFALTGKENSPGIFDIMFLLGKDIVLKRISICLEQ